VISNSPDDGSDLPMVAAIAAIAEIYAAAAASIAQEKNDV
jgi:hypothetical protein